MNQYLIDTFRYNDWANRQMLKLIREMPEPAGAIRLFSHLITSQNKWMARIRRDPNEAQKAWFEAPYPIDELESRWSESLAAWLGFLVQAQSSDLDAAVTYTAGDGKDYSSKVREIALQLNYHSIHHRAQINQLARQQGLNPPFIDYIGFVRVKA